MQKLNMQTANLADEKYKLLVELFPNAITEARDEKGNITRSIDADILRQEININVVEGNEERYQFTWPDKKKAMAEAHKPITSTLRPCREESVDFDTTENLYIEGDNLEVLKLLRETYLGKIKMIYIDPPYNTGNDFIYKDKWNINQDDWDDMSGEYDEDGNKLVKNPDSNGRFHTDWLNMIYPRLKVARDLLSDDGVIFISIDDNEVENLKKVCNEIFGEGNFVAIVNWKGRGGRQDSKFYAAVHEYIIIYTKHISNFVAGEEIKSKDVFPKFDNSCNRFYKTQLLRKWGTNSRREDRPNLYYPILAPDGQEIFPEFYEKDKLIQGRWRHSIERMNENIKLNKVEFIKDKNNQWIAYEKIFAPKEGEYNTKKYTTWIEDVNSGATIIKDLFEIKVFDYPKSQYLIIKFIQMANIESDDIILDFFSGSATTAHAVMQLNAEDGGNRRFIMVQLPEECAKDSEAAKAGYKNICEIGKERIRRAAKKIKEDKPDANFDGGFRVLKLSSSNMRDVFYKPDDLVKSQGVLIDLVSNFKVDRTSEDLLFQVMLDIGVSLSSKIAKREIDGKSVFFVNDNYLIACFERVNDELVTKIAQEKPYYAVFRDSSFDKDSALVNFEQIFATYSPKTIRKVL